MHMNAQSDRLAYSVAEACNALSISKSHLYALVRQGKIDIRKAGRRTLIPAASVRSIVTGEAA